MKNFCGNCGREIDKKTGLCPNCDKATLDAMKKKQKRMLSIIIAVSVVVVGSVIAWFAMRKTGHETNNEGKKENIYATYEIYNSFMEGFTDVQVTDEESALEAVHSVAESLGIEDTEKELQVNKIQSVKDETFYRIQQYYEDIPVYGSGIVVAADKDGKVTALTSSYKKIPKDVELTPSVSSEEIKKSINKYLDAEDVQISAIDKEALVVYELEDGKCVLAYQIYTSNAERIFVNAQTAEVIQYKQILRDVATTVKSKDGKTTSIGWLDNEGNYQLYNEEHKITVFDVEGIDTKRAYLDFRNYGIDVISSKTNEFDKNGVILLNDVLKVSNFYAGLGYDGFDQMHVAINDGFDRGENARGGGVSRGDFQYGIMLIGSKFNYENKEVIAHEYTHAVTGQLVDWGGNSNQNEALNEAYSDIFGILFENSQHPDWKMEHLSRVIRNISNPSETGNYASMSDIKKTGKIDEYTISTIVSHAAYLMWNGIDGNKEGKIDADTLSELWYQSILLLQSDADFSQCRNAVELSARIMLNNGEITKEQYKTVISAFETVEIENAPYTFNETVKNQFELQVLSSKETENVQYKLEVFRVLEHGYPDQSSELIMMKDAVVGKQVMELSDGTYILRISDVSAENNIAQSIHLKIVVYGEGEMSADKVVVNTDFVQVISGEERPEEKKEINDDMIKELKDSLVNQYGLSSQEKFVSCLGAEIKSYPSEINGIISMTDVDIDKDGINEILVVRVKGTENGTDATIIADIYQYRDGAFLLTTSESLYGILFCSGADIYLFYSDVLKQYCLMVDSASIGSYTGVNSFQASIYTVTNDEIKQYKTMEAVPFMDIEIDFETEFAKIGVPHAKYCAEYNRLSDSNYYKQLCEVEHEIFGDPSGYETRNHRLRIVKPGSNQSSESEESVNVWKSIPDVFIFTSGAGAWVTEIEIDDDGTFRGVFHDSNMGEMGEDYPNGTVYVCEFEGKFTTPKKVSDTIYSMKLEKMTVKETPGKVYIEDGVKYICSDPYGFDDANEFLIYMPGTPISDVEEEFLSWSFLEINSIQEIPESFYGIYNIGGEQGFIADERYD